MTAGGTGHWRGVPILIMKLHNRGPPMMLQAPWHFLYFLPLPQGHGSLRPIFAGTVGRGDGAAVGVRPLPPARPLWRELPPEAYLAGTLWRSSELSVLAWPLVLAISSTLVRRLRGARRLGAGSCCSASFNSKRRSLSRASTI